MKHPNEYWLKYLILFSGMTPKQIASTAGLYEFPAPSSGYILELTATLGKTKPKPFRTTSAKTRAWIRRQRVMSLFKDDKDALAARELLGIPRARRVINALLLADTPPQEIAGHVLSLTGQSPTAKTISLYRHYFWNTKLLSIREWVSYLKDHCDGRVLESCLHQGAEHALWKLGHRVEVAQEDVLRGIFHESSMRFFELSQSENGRDTALTAKLWAESVFRAAEELSRSGDAVKQVIGELKNMAIRLGRRDISSIDVLDGEVEGKEDCDV
jgi:hypothetical protein